MLSDWLDTIELVTDADTVWVKLAMIFFDSGNNENKNFVRNLASD